MDEEEITFENLNDSDYLRVIKASVSGEDYEEINSRKNKPFLKTKIYSQ